MKFECPLKCGFIFEVGVNERETEHHYKYPSLYCAKFRELRMRGSVQLVGGGYFSKELCFKCGREAAVRRSHGRNRWYQSYACVEHRNCRAPSHKQSVSPFAVLAAACLRKR